MRVAILGQFPTDLSRLGGVEVAIVYLMDTLAAVGVDDLHIVSCRTEIGAPQTKQIGAATVHYLPRANQGRLTWHLRETRRMRELLREIRPDIVHGHSTGLYAGAALGSGFANVITAHGIVAREVALYRGLGMRLRGSIDVLYERYCLARARHVIAISPYVQQVFAPLTKARFHLIENAVDRAFFDLAPQPEPGRILFAGAVIERKGLLPLIEALPRLREAVPHIELRIAGSTAVSPAYYRKLLQIAGERDLSRSIVYLGQLDQQALLEEYARCAVFVLPSFQETAPMAVQQALAAAVPVVATSVGGVPDLVGDGKTGLLVPPAASAALADALVRLLCNNDLRPAFAAEARSAALQRFLPEVVAGKTRAVYDEVIAEAARGRTQ